MTTPDHHPLEHRLRRAEEAIGFTEHTTEQLAGEVAKAHQAIARLASRLAALEARLAAVEEGPHPATDDTDDDDERADP